MVTNIEAALNKTDIIPEKETGEVRKRSDDIISSPTYGALASALIVDKKYPEELLLSSESPLSQKEILAAWMMSEEVGFSKTEINYGITHANKDKWTEERKLAEDLLEDLENLDENALINAWDDENDPVIKRSHSALTLKGYGENSPEIIELKRLNAAKKMYDLYFPNG